MGKNNLVQRLKEHGLLGSTITRVDHGRDVRESPLQNHLLHVMEKYELTKQKITFGGKEGLKEYLTECMIDFTKNMNDGMLRLMWEGYIK